MNLVAKYSTLVNLPVVARRIAQEERANYVCVQERHLQILWWEQLYLRPLVTATGEAVTVLSAGLWNAGRGPDFRRAHLRIGAEEVRGDVEIHLSDEGWWQHGHDHDPAYEDTVLHVSLWPPAQPRQLYTAGGRPLVQLYLADQLTLPLEKIIALLDIDLYPSQPPVGAGRCATAVFNRLSAEQREAFLASAALWRLHLKGERLAQQAQTLEAQWKLGLALCLGLPHNTLLFGKLYRWLHSQAADSNASTLQALCMGASGFFGPHYRQLWEKSTYYQTLLSIWQRHESHVFEMGPSQHKSVRPQNHPVRRFAALGHMLHDASLTAGYARLQAVWQERWQLCQIPRHYRALWRALQATLPSYQDAYWEHHYLFETEPKAQSIALLGAATKNEILFNVALPLLYRHRIEQATSEEQEAFLHLYRYAPASQHNQARFLRHRFFDDNPAAIPLFQQAIAEQGALQIHSDFCRHFEVSCIGCPFVERVQQAGYLPCL